MDNLKLDAIGVHKCTLFEIVTNLDKDGRDQSRCVGRCITQVEPMIKV